MIKNFTFFALSCVLITFLFSCTKDPQSGANPGGSSIFTLAGAPTSCASPTVAGLYSAGLELSGSNTITVSVNVVAKGSYNLYTNNSNGVYFTGSGTFTGTGPQSVVLTGKGTPKAAGNFYFVFATNNTCSFSVTFNSGTGAASFTYAGGTGNCTAPVVSGTYASGTPLGASNYVDLTVNVTTPGTYSVSTTTVNGFNFSANGVFSTTGNQPLRLQGGGTPGAPGSNTFTPAGGCAFSIAVVAPLPTAAFTYTNCGSVVPNGTYTAGTALNSSNTIVLTVNVTTPGAYSVSTNLQNGVTFRGFGSFSATGPNSITLTSTDTPGSAGPFTYTLSGGCAFNVTYTGGGGGGDVFTCTINGVIKDFSKNLLVILDQSSAPYSFHVDGDLQSGTDNFSIDLNDDNSPIAAGSYKNVLLPPQAKYCSIAYDNGGTLPFGSSFTNPNSFTVTVTQITATKVIGTFSGTLYDQFGTGTVTRSITAGSFSVTY